MPRSKLTSKWAHIIKDHHPAGYDLKIKTLKGKMAAYALFAREIVVHGGIETREELFNYLHECGHVRNGHLTKECASMPVWRCEYEADQYAINAMRTNRIPVPRGELSWHKEIVRDHLTAAHERGEEIDDHDVLKYAYGRRWREHI